jgi:hypothetical protein
VNCKDWGETVRDPEVKLSAEGFWFLMWLTVAWWRIVVPSLEEVSVHDGKTSCTFFSFDEHLYRVAWSGLEVE